MINAMKGADPVSEVSTLVRDEHVYQPAAGCADYSV